MEQTFKDRPWPFVPECLSEIISEDVLEIIQTGIALKEKIPLLIVEFKDGEPKEIMPIHQPRIRFCEDFRSIELPDGTRPGDETCRICDYYHTAQELMDKKDSKAYPHSCHLGITKMTAPIVVANKVVAIFFAGGMIYPEHTKDVIIENFKDWSEGKLNMPVHCIEKLRLCIDIEDIKKVPQSKIKSLVECLRETKPSTKDKFQERKKQIENYTMMVSRLANSIYIERKRAKEEEFFHRIASIFDTSESANIEQLKKTVSKVLDEICNFCGLSSAILFASQDRGDNILDLLGAAKINISDLHLNLNPAKRKESPSEPIIAKDVQRYGFRGKDTEKIEGSIPLPVTGDENGYRTSLVLSHPSPDAIISESKFFDSLSRLIGANMANRLADIDIARQRDNISREYDDLREHATDVAHDFRIGLQPISTEIGEWRDLCDKGTCSSGANERYKTISEAVKKLSEDAKRTLVSKKFYKEHASLSSIILNCIEDYRRVAKDKQITIKVDDSIKKLPSAFIERENISLAIRNILDNAIKYSFPKTTIDVFRKRDRYEMVSIAFESYGIGIHPSEKEKVFERRYRTKRARELVRIGSGIGLSEASEIIKRHRGEIKINSWKEVDPDVKEGYKTRVTISLPK
jgi:signal transduction histidine kinase/ligand-binding sensor protein